MATKLTDAQRRDVAAAMGFSDVSVVDDMTPEAIVDAWLKWNGIINYTDGIYDIIERAHDTRLRPLKW